MLAAASVRRLRASAFQSILRNKNTRTPVEKSCLGIRTAATYTSRHQAAQISVLQSAVDTGSSAYVENARSMRELLDKFTSLHQDAAVGGPEKARDKHIAKGKMLVRE